MEVVDDIALSLENDDLSGAKELVDEKVMTNEICIGLYSKDVDQDHFYISGMRGCSLDRLSMNQIDEIQDYIDKDRSYLGTLEQKFPDDILMVYGKSVDFDDYEILVLAATRIVPLNATTNTIKRQYILIASIIIAMTIILALIVSRYLVKPIRQISEEAVNLDKGTYDKDHIKTYSREYDDLNLTLGDANTRINESDRFKKELIGNVSHDLKTPLTMIVGYGELIRDFKEENNENNINVIIDEANRLSYLVNDLIDMSKINSSGYELNREDISINKLIEEVYRQYQGYLKQNKIDFKLELAEDQTVNVDVRRIKQVLYNFINNANNYNSKDNKQITIKTEIADKDIKISVIDNGDGIEQKDIRHIFDRYYKVDKEHKRQSVGSGIGLSLNREILEAHGFVYGVDSKLGEYSDFYFYVPINTSIAQK